MDSLVWSIVWLSFFLSFFLYIWYMKTFFLVLCEFCTVCVGLIQPLPNPHTYTLSYLLDFVFSFSYFFKHQSSSIRAAHIYFCCVALPWCVVVLPRAAVLKKPGFPFPGKLSVANSFLTRDRTLWLSSISLLGFGLDWVCTDLVHTVTISVSSQRSLPAMCGWQFPCSHPSPLTPMLCLPSLLQRSLSFVRRRCNTHVPFVFSIAKSLILCTLDLYINHHLWKIEVFLMRVERWINLWL